MTIVRTNSYSNHTQANTRNNYTTMYMKKGPRRGGRSVPSGGGWRGNLLHPLFFPFLFYWIRPVPNISLFFLFFSSPPSLLTFFNFFFPHTIGRCGAEQGRGGDRRRGGLGGGARAGMPSNSASYGTITIF